MIGDDCTEDNGPIYAFMMLLMCLTFLSRMLKGTRSKFSLWSKKTATGTAKENCKIGLK